MQVQHVAQACSRRAFLQSGVLALGGLGLLVHPRPADGAWGPNVLPSEPIEIGRQPQFLFDLHVVDCTWALKEKHEPVKRVFHACTKHPANPLLTGDQPSHLWVVRDQQAGLFRMWYQLNQLIEYKEKPREKGQGLYQSYVAYAQSKDGIAWEKPAVDSPAVQGDARLPRNTVLPHADTPQILELPEKDRRGYRYVMLYYGTGNIRLIGSHDGIHWDEKSDTVISRIHSDHHNTVVYDAEHDEYVLFLRAKHIYLAPGQGRERIDSGQSRRGVARMTSKQLWTEWTSPPQTILMPDEVDADHGYNYFYGMPVFPYAGIYWGFLQSFRLNDFMHGELAWSRDGVHFDRLPQRPKIIEYGPDGSWDDTMILACPAWVEVGDEWWVYYNGWDGPHGTPDRTGGIGLAKIRKGGFISLRGPQGGGVVCTRQLRWPGGALIVNADASQGELKIRVSDELRRPVFASVLASSMSFSGGKTLSTRPILSASVAS